MTCWSQFPHLSMYALHYFDFRGLPAFYVLWFFMKAVLSWGLKHTWCQPNFMLKVLESQLEREDRALSLYLFTITPLMGQMRLFCMSRECFCRKLLWLIAVFWCQEVAYGSWGREGSRACVRCAVLGLSQG